jgi:hypothetical protein
MCELGRSNCLPAARAAEVRGMGGRRGKTAAAGDAGLAPQSWKRRGGRVCEAEVLGCTGACMECRRMRRWDAAWYVFLENCTES